jgi:hypothetical protein
VAVLQIVKFRPNANVAPPNSRQSTSGSNAKSHQSCPTSSGEKPPSTRTETGHSCFATAPWRARHDPRPTTEWKLPAHS